MSNKQRVGVEEGFGGRECLITGGAGFIGSHLAEALLSSGANVTVVDSLVTGREANLDAVRSSVSVIKAPVVDALRDGTVQVETFDYLFHLAGNPYIPPSVEDPSMDYDRNLDTPFRLLEAIRKASRRPRLVNISTAAVYGNPVSIPMRETDVTVPISPYGVSKLAAERYADVFAKLYGIEAASLRLFSVYGPRQRKQVVYDLFRKVRAKTSSIEVYGDGTQERDMVFVLDVVRAAMIVAAKAPAKGETYNVATGTTHSIRGLVEKICQVCGLYPEIRYTGQVRPGDAEKWEVDINRLKALGYLPRFTLDEGLARVRDWLDAELM